jgi:hypothetical protein
MKRKVKKNKSKKIKKMKKNHTMKKKNNNNNIVKLNCSPSVNNTKKNDKDINYSCLTNDSIFKLKSLWNMRHRDDMIKSNDQKEIWDALHGKLKSVCNKESCWLKQKFVDGKLNKELHNSFAPDSPDEWNKNPVEWLSSIDINNVMKQYEKAYKCFEFIGPSPIDYDTRKMYGECVWQELCEFDLEQQIKNGKNKIGIIFNLDPHTLDGSHWVSLFINIKRKMIFFFDSAGEKIPHQIMKFVNNVIKQGNALDIPIHFKFDQNYPVEHQMGDTECGVYSLFFIVHMLEDKINAHYLKTHILKDEYMTKFRKIYFNSRGS